ncbi:sigma-54 interaction domain-containing protein [Ectobacillus funiculus]|uniref:sigma-54 interaction domain-containing protein n=1 Tax=Ectobacillus funiculus TaxID=137993 RepID=UPI00101C9864|nr:sigma 54-interacting transcriptional regulator [Ectobacillus funiculus]
MTEELEILKLELEGIINASNDNIVVTDGQGIVLRAIRNSEEIYGEVSSTLVGRSVFELEKENIFSPSVTARVLKEKKEVQVMQKTRTGMVIMATGIPIFDKQKNIIRVISFSHNLTEIQKLKEDYEQLQSKMKRYESEIEELRGKETKIGDIVIECKTMQTVWELVNRVARSDATVVLLGESGVGKTVFARALHNRSERKKEPFIEINCGAIPTSLFESELFGYEPGAFTGANHKGKIGMIELAHKGTLFLDEIGELPLDIQVKLLKVLQEKSITKIGGGRSKKVDFRLVAATNQDLEYMVKQGKFREDLFYRLNVVPIHIPSLRKRKEDIYQLIEHFLSKFNRKYQTNKFFHSAAIDACLEYEWPGNVRELENLIERLVVTSDTNTIYHDNLPFIQKNQQNNDTEVEWSSLTVFEERGLTLQDALEEVEKCWLLRAYRQCKTTYEMAETLGLSQATVVRRLKKYNINSK